MEDFFDKKRRASIKRQFSKLDIAVGTNLSKRYEEWLSIMDAAHANYRREAPEGLSDCVSYLIKKSDIEKWIATEDLYSVRPDYRYYYRKEALAEYDCGIAYYFTHRFEFKSNIIRCENILAIDPADRFAGTKNSYEDIHIPFSPELQTARMVVDAKLPHNTERLRHKAVVYDKIICYVAIQTLGLEAMPLINEVIFDKRSKYGDLTEVKKVVESALKKIEIEQCKRKGIEWTDKKPDPKYW